MEVHPQYARYTYAIIRVALVGAEAQELLACSGVHGLTVRALRGYGVRCGPPACALTHFRPEDIREDLQRLQEIRSDVRERDSAAFLSGHFSFGLEEDSLGERR